MKRGGKVAEPVVVLEKKVEGKRVIRNLALGPRGKVAVLSLALAVDTTDQGGRVNVFGGEGEQGEDEEVEVESDVERILWTDQGNILVLNGQKRLYSRKSCSFSLIKQYHLLTSTKKNPAVSSKEPIDITLPSQPTSILLAGRLLFTLSPTSKLHMTALTAPFASVSLAQQPVTSFTLTSSFLIYTTTSHFAHFAPLVILERLANGEDLGGVGSGNELKWEERRIERGAKIVVASESEMSLVLQATRGNLETIYPRPMVLQVVKRDVLGQVQSCLRYQGGTYADQSKTLKNP